MRTWIFSCPGFKHAAHLDGVRNQQNIPCVSALGTCVHPSIHSFHRYLQHACPMPGTGGEPAKIPKDPASPDISQWSACLTRSWIEVPRYASEMQYTWQANKNGVREGVLILVPCSGCLVTFIAITSGCLRFLKPSHPRQRAVCHPGCPLLCTSHCFFLNFCCQLQ